MNGNETTENIRQALNTQKAQIGQFNHAITVARFEPTNAAKGLVGTCGRTRIDIGSGGTHCTPKADIGIQGLKRIARYINSGLPWTCPMTWVPHLVTAAKVLKAARASSVNRHPLPPVTVLTGKKLTAADFLFAFGDYVEADAPSPVSNAAQKDRSVGAIVLYQNINGTWECMNLATKMLLHREASQLTLMPTTQAVIDRVNEIAAADKKKCKKKHPVHRRITSTCIGRARRASITGEPSRFSIPPNKTSSTAPRGDRT